MLLFRLRRTFENFPPAALRIVMVIGLAMSGCGSDSAAGRDGIDGMDGQDGIDGADGRDATDGSRGTDGTSCSVQDNGDGSKTIRCEDGTEVIVQDGDTGAPGADGKPGLIDPLGDLDGDGVINAKDNCLFDANASQLDADFDNVGDACDVHVSDFPLALDTANGLMWTRCPFGETPAGTDCLGTGAPYPTFCAAQDNSCNGGSDTGLLNGLGASSLYEACGHLVMEGYSDFRVPTKSELLELVNGLMKQPPFLFPGPSTHYFWSSTSASANAAWTVDSLTGVASGADKNNTSRSVYCVRSR